jgi:hypothetical protein
MNALKARIQRVLSRVNDMKQGKVLFLAMLLGLVACGPSPTPAEVTPTPTSPPPLTLEALETAVASPGYLGGCRSLSNTLLTNQISYKGVVPGLSTHDDVTNLLGEADRKAQTDDTWIYDDGVSILFSRNAGEPVVDVIDVYDVDNGTVLAQMSEPLSEMVKEFGCPEIVYAYDPAIDNRSGRYDVTVFAYPTIGIELKIPHYPVSLNSKPDEIFIFASKSVSDYLSERQWILDPDTAVVPSWDQAVLR